MVYFQILLGIGCVAAVAAAIYYNVTNAAHLQAHTTTRRSQRPCSDNDFNDTKDSRRFPKSKPGDRCAICTEVMERNNMHTMTCGHALHQTPCHHEYRLWRRNCPYCDQVVFRIDKPGDNCSICCHEMQSDNMQYLKCEHALHTECLNTLLDNKICKCPVCLRSL